MSPRPGGRRGDRNPPSSGTGVVDIEFKIKQPVKVDIKLIPTVSVTFEIIPTVSIQIGIL